MFVRNSCVIYGPPSAEPRIGRFERYLDASRSRGVVWFTERRGAVGRCIERPKTVNVTYLSPLPGQSRAQRRHNRRQASSVFPMLAPLFKRPRRQEHDPPSWKLGWIAAPIRRQIVRGVDEGEPLTPILTRVLKTKPWILRHLAQYDAAFRQSFSGNVRDALQAVGWATPELAPTDDWELEDFRTLTLVLNTLPDLNEAQDRRAFKHLLRDYRLVTRLCHFVLFVQDLIRWVALQRRDSNRVPPEEALGISSLSQWLQREHCWCRAIRAQRSGALLKELGSDLDRRVQWPGLFEGVVRYEGYEFVPLTDRAALVEEAQAMQNCVLSYLGRALVGKTHLVSVRDRGERIATVEVEYEEGEGWNVVQATGPANEALDDDVGDAIEGFVALVTSSPKSCAPTSTTPSPGALFRSKRKTTCSRKP